MRLRDPATLSAGEVEAWCSCANSCSRRMSSQNQARSSPFLCHVYNRMRDPSSHSYAPTRHIPETGVMTQQRKQSHDDEKSRSRRIDNDAGYDFRTFICACGWIRLPGLARNDRPLGPASAPCLQCFLSGDGATDGRGQCAPLSWRTEIERLTSPWSLHVGKLTSPGKQRSRTLRWPGF